MVKLARQNQTFHQVLPCRVHARTYARARVENRHEQALRGVTGLWVGEIWCRRRAFPAHPIQAFTKETLRLTTFNRFFLSGEPHARRASPLLSSSLVLFLIQNLHIGNGLGGLGVLSCLSLICDDELKSRPISAIPPSQHILTDETKASKESIKPFELHWSRNHHTEKRDLPCRPTRHPPPLHAMPYPT
ncbi:hypothetical protein DM02DRAFT_395504 [Periconia macrospinosa]|uniref:Uncharacterized protein n=1 Tax=Periconia macrospinosa TaxID=97972 RepID=A0A2V1DQW8_9PLEO|nr:hypothetical protein DM02DRAFT_395504 [Periconia macrospinosa]